MHGVGKGGSTYLREAFPIQLDQAWGKKLVRSSWLKSSEANHNLKPGAKQYDWCAGTHWAEAEGRRPGEQIGRCPKSSNLALARRRMRCTRRMMLGEVSKSPSRTPQGFWDAIFWWEVVGVQDAELRLRDDIQQLKKLEEEWKEMVKLLKIGKTNSAGNSCYNHLSVMSWITEELELSLLTWLGWAWLQCYTVWSEITIRQTSAEARQEDQQVDIKLISNGFRGINGS